MQFGTRDNILVFATLPLIPDRTGSSLNDIKEIVEHVITNLKT